MSEDPASLNGMTWPVDRTLFKFFVVWSEDDVDECCIGAESLQHAMNSHTVVLRCLACGEKRQSSCEVAELVI